jgi:hypothetical protein
MRRTSGGLTRKRQEQNEMKWLVINTEAFSPKGLDKKLLVGKTAKGKNIKRPVAFADLPWVVQKFLSAYSNAFVILDECFVAGTPVDCIRDNGTIFQKSIDFVNAGDRILNALGGDYVEATARKEVRSLVEFRAGRNTFACSENHLFLTLRGWRPAKDLRTGDYLVETAEAMRLLRENIHPAECLPKMAAFLREKLFRPLADGTAGCPESGLFQGKEQENIGKSQGFYAERSTGSKKENGENSRPQADETEIGGIKNDDNKIKKRHIAHSAETRRQWQGYAGSCTVSPTRTWTRMAARIRGIFRKEEKRIPDELQTGYCLSCPNDRNRGRRSKPQREKTVIRQEKGCHDGLVRVEGITVLKPGNSELDKYRDAGGHIHCYDIKAKWHPSFSVNGVLVHNCSKIKTNTPKQEEDKSIRTRLIKLVGKYATHRCIMTGTLMSKSPLNVVDQYNFLREDYFPESMWGLAERYCVMITIQVGRGRRVLINQKDYAMIRTRLKNAFIRGGETQLEAAKTSIFKQFALDYVKQEHIIRHRKYTPFINERELLRRIAPDTLFVRREDVFDIRFDKFVKEPIMRPVKLSKDAKRIANELIELGFTDRLVLGKAPALELMTRLQDICNGFEPVKDDEGKVSYRLFSENPKLDELIDLMEEINVNTNQIVVWASRRNLLDICAARFEKEGYTFVRYDGSARDTDKEAAEQAFTKREASIFLANQSSGAFGLNCLSQCSYAVYMCIDGSVEKYHQSQHRILRGQLHAPKFAYAIYAEGTVEERQWTALKVGQELLEADNRKEKFIFV